MEGGSGTGDLHGKAGAALDFASEESALAICRCEA